MTASTKPELNVAEIFKALSDPIRWDIVQQMAAAGELACSTLEHTLPISKPTISYHTKILVQAGLVSVRKQGRNFFYTLRRDALQQITDELWGLAPRPRSVRDGAVEAAPRWRSANGSRARAAGAENDPVLLTW